MTLLSTILYILFVLSALVLIVVILLQEGRGGGFGQALGEHGQQTFGVGAKGINTFTAWTAALFLGSALLLHGINRGARGSSALDELEGITNPELPGGFDGFQTSPAQAPPADPGG